MTAALMVLAGDEGIQAFNPVNGTGLDEFRQRPVDLQWRAKTLLAKRVKNVVGACRLSRFMEVSEDEVFVSGSVHGPSLFIAIKWFADDAVMKRACQTCRRVACVSAGC